MRIRQLMSASDVGKDTPRLKLGMYMRKRVKEPSHGQWVRVAGRCREPNRDRVMTGLGRRLHRGHLSGTCGVHIVQENESKQFIVSQWI